MEITIAVLIIAAVVGFIVYSRKRARNCGAGGDRPSPPTSEK